MGAAALYHEVNKATAKKLQGQARRIRNRMSHQTMDIIETGRDLLATKEEVGHGFFIRWVEGECGISMRMAQHYMRAAVWVDANREETKLVSFLEPTAVIELSRKSTPDNVRRAVFELVEEAEHHRVSTTKVRDVIKAHREAKEQPQPKEWDAAREVALAKAAARRKREKGEQKPTDVGDDLLLADFYAAWGALPEHRRVEALLEINADMHLNLNGRRVPAFALRPIQ